MNRLMMAGALLALAGCNTAQGLGKDLQQVGGVITGTAEGVQNGAATSGRTLVGTVPGRRYKRGITQ